MLPAASKVNRGQKLRDQGNLQEALTLFQQAVEIDPSNDMAAHEIRGTQQMMQKGPTGAGQGSSPPARRDENHPLRRPVESASGPGKLTQIPHLAAGAPQLENG